MQTCTSRRSVVARQGYARAVLCHLRVGPFAGWVFGRKFPWLGKEVWREGIEKFTDAQKAFVIKQSEEGTPVAEVCRKAGISQATYFNWKKKYAGLLPSEM